MSNLDRIAEQSAKLEGKTDAVLTKLVNFPYSWVPVLVIFLLAAYGVIKLLS